VPAPNNTSERDLGPSVMFRKVSNGFRAEWGAATYTAYRSVVSTAKLKGDDFLGAIRNGLHGPPNATTG